jgi:beta-N-acetylhexosaminidase
VGPDLFKRNIQDKNQVIDLVREALHELGGEAPVLIDQEGGRVQRLGRRIGRPIRQAPPMAGSTTAIRTPASRRLGSARA